MCRSSASMCLGVLVLGLLADADRPKALAQDTTPLAFDVASVKRAEPTLPRGIQVFPGRFTSTDMPLISLIGRAYGVPRWKIRNAPDWVRTDGFNVQAAFPRSSTPAQVNAMLRTLLEQRFRLSVQMEVTEMDTDVLILANRDRPLGPGMHPVNVDCQTNQLRDASAPGLFPPERRPPCGSFETRVTFSPVDVTKSQRALAVRYSAFTMTDLADLLSGSRERPLLDETELSGQFDIELDYASQAAPAAAPDPRTVASTPGGAPPLAEALERQLGLKLRRERNRVEVMIVRSVERLRSEEN
jgi:uncharacterized protein (TIGR03435 family)